MGSILGGVLGGGNSDGQEKQQAALAQANQGYQQYRPELFQAMMNSLNQANSAYQPANNMLETMYGTPKTGGSPMGQQVAAQGPPQAQDRMKLGGS